MTSSYSLDLSFGGYIASVANVTALRNTFDTTGRTLGDTVIVSGNRGVSDGLGGIYTWLPDALDDDDGYSVVAPVSMNAGPGRWKLSVGPSPELVALAQQVTACQTSVAAVSHSLVPSGAVIMWSGATNTIPVGWLLCDGQHDTPDLRGRFVIGAGGYYDVGTAGGNTSGLSPISISPAGAASVPVSGTTASASSGVHLDYTTYSTYAGGGTQVAVAAGKNGAPPTLTDPGHTHSFSATATLADHTHNVSAASDQLLPPYFALCFIMKA